MRTKLGAASAAILLALTMAACGGDDSGGKKDEPKKDAAPASIEAGDCIDVGNNDPSQEDDAAYSTENVVDCEDVHQFEVLAVEDVPEDLVTDDLATEDYRLELDDTIHDLEADDDLVDINAWSVETCNNAFAEATGLDAIEIDGQKAGDDFSVLAATSGVSSWLVYPVESWEERPRISCLARYSELSDDRNPSEADLVDIDGGFLIGDFLSSDFSEDFRQCATFDVEDNFLPVSCSDAHYQEYGFTFDATDLVDQGLRDRITEAGVLGISLSDEDYAILDDLCVQGLEVIAGEGVDTDVVTGLAEPGGGWDPEGAARANWVICSVTPVDAANFDLPGGSVFGIGDAEIELVPFGG